MHNMIWRFCANYVSSHWLEALLLIKSASSSFECHCRFFYLFKFFFQNRTSAWIHRTFYVSNYSVSPLVIPAWVSDSELQWMRYKDVLVHFFADKKKREWDLAGKSRQSLYVIDEKCVLYKEMEIIEFLSRHLFDIHSLDLSIF